MLSTTKPMPKIAHGVTLLQVIQRRAEVQPAAPAILAPGRVPLSAKELALLTRRFHHHLRACGITRPDRVAVMLPSSPEMAAAFLGIACSAACVPIQPTLAAAEAATRLAATRAKALVTAPGVNPEIVNQAERRGVKIIQLSISTASPAGWFSWDERLAAPEQETAPGPASTDIALILPTSGTTAHPKLALLTHCAICTPVIHTAESLELNAQDCCLNMLPLFHVHGLISALIMPLAAGGSVVITGGFRAQDFGAWMAAFAPTWYSASPAMHQALLEEQRVHPCALGRLRFIRSGSAPLTARLISELEAAFKAPMIEAYGMTEVPQITGNPLSKRKAGSVGRSIAPELAIMDETGEILPPSKTGEIVVRGPTVLAGYESAAGQDLHVHHREWFHTGDLGWLDDEGYLFLTGRLKEIINRGGQKISPRAIDEALLAHPAIHQAVAFPVPHATLGEDVAVAVVPKEGCQVSEDELRQFVAQRLSDFMVPSRILAVKEIPLGPAGKVQRRALAEKLESQLAVAYEPPAPGVEQQVAEVFQQTLHLPQPVGKNDNFFFLGGDSLRGMQALAKLYEALGLEIPPATLFRKPTVAGLAKELATLLETANNQKDRGLMPEASNSPARRESAPEGGVFPLSFSQQRLWFLDQFEPESAAYHMTQAVRLRGGLKRDALERALNAMVARHESLRTRFTVVDGRPVQVVAPALTIALPVVDASALENTAREAAIAAALHRASNEPFRLSQGPLLRMTLVKLGEREHLLVMTFHHIVFDGWSKGVFHRELAALYEAFLEGGSHSLQPLPIQYPDYAVWQRQWLQGRRLERQLDYWRRQLAHAPALALPTDHPRPPRQTYAGARHVFSLPPALSVQLKTFNQREGATPFMTLLGVFQVLLSRYSGQADILVGTPIANRQRVVLEGLIGFFVNTLVMRGDLSGDPGLAEVVARVRRMALDAYQHQNLPFEKLVEELNPVRDLSRHPLFQVTFAVQNAPEHPLALVGLEVSPCPLPQDTTHFDLELHCWEQGDHWQGAFFYNTGLFNPETMERMAGHYLKLLGHALAEPERPVAQWPILSATEQRQLLVAWNDTAREYPKDKRVPQLFEEQADRTPDAVAVVFEGQQLTYRELNQRANQLAWHLRGLGVQSETLVGICVERSLEMLIGLLGIWKAAGAYVPLDPAYPRERLEFMARDSQLSVLLTLQHLDPDWASALQARRVFLDASQAPWRSEQTGNLMGPGNCGSLAYVLYTSGSTGQPKGVAVEQRSVVNLLCAMQTTLGVNDQDVVLAATSLGFDIAVLELWLPLLVGARLVISPNIGRIGGEAVCREIDRQGITVFQSTPSTWQLLLKSGWAGKPGLKALCGGEALPQELASQICERCGALWNLYGPTETTIWSAAARVTRKQPIVIGRPIANTQVYILDEHRHPVPVGVAGELFIGGDGLARGYLNRPELNAEHFVPNPFSHDPKARLYRTGDRGRWLSGGDLEFLGRLDNQVKVRGYRVELGEVEAALLRHPEVQEAAVMAAPAPGGTPALAAYLVVRAGGRLELGELRQHLVHWLPDYMIPSGFTVLAKLPLNANGKVDRRALAKMEGHKLAASTERVSPRNLLEEQLVAIWKEVLGLSEVGIYDNFFDLGGHSLPAIRLVAELKRVLGRPVPVAAVFQCPTIESMARMLAEGQGAPSPWTALVPLQPKGSKPPFYFVHGLGGGVFHFWDVALLLDADQPSYALLAVRDREQPRHARVEEMAAHYAREIRIHQPQGPYYLGGYSAGGWIAYATAQELRRQGQPVAMLALLDTYPSTLLPRWLCWSVKGFHLVARCLFHGQQFWRMKGQSRWQYFLGRLVALKHSVRRNYPRSAQAAPAPPADPRPASPDRDYYAEAVSQYQPAPYDSSVDLFVCEGSHVLHQRPFLWYLLRGGMNIHRVPGTHFTVMVDEDHLRAFSRVFAAALRQAQERARLSQAP